MSESDLEKTLKKTKIRISDIAEALGCATSTIYYHIRHPEETDLKRQIRAYLKRIGKELSK